jgi:tRNA 5-methylaminomethyl-2-thiouridine biosynthesis bifunctional protein
MKSLARLAAPGATAATWSAARAVREALAGAGFEVRAAPGSGAKRDITLARHAPRFVPPRPPGREVVPRAPGQALIVGAGLAGAAAARALAAHGVSCTVLDAQSQPATQASGNPAGLFHGTVARDDTTYSRWFRAASFEAARWVRDTPGAGAADGLLRLNDDLDIEAMRALLAAQALPAEYLQALDAASASQRAGLTLRRPAWWFTAGGWADPRALVRTTLEGAGVQWRSACEVAALEATGDGWCARDHEGRAIAAAEIVVLCNGADAVRLASLPCAWIECRRGQVSWLPVTHAALAPGLPQAPLASGSYLLTLPDRGGTEGARLLFGATQQAEDDDTRVRDSDHADNLARAQRLIGCDLARPGAPIEGRVGFRVASRDRLPLAGLAPDLRAPLPARRDAPRLVPRRRGLFVLAALGSRGLTSAALAGELVAAQAVGAPWPIEADLADALDPARWALAPRSR